MLSILDLCPITKGSSAKEAFRNSQDLARSAEKWGYHRYWLAEHHNMPGVGSSATSVLLAFIGQSTSRIRIGSGGIMLPNHSPYVVAEQFGTLESLYPGRVDLGIGRSPGADPVAINAIRRGRADSVATFADDLKELLDYFSSTTPEKNLRAVPGNALDIPVWMLGSSIASANIAASLGLGFVFAAHTAPENLVEALTQYRHAFTPSKAFPVPYSIVSIPVFVADTCEEADRLFSSMQRQFLDFFRRKPAALPPPTDSIGSTYTHEELNRLSAMLREAIVGTPELVKDRMQSLVRRAKPDEIMITAQIFDHEARLKSFEMARSIF